MSQAASSSHSHPPHGFEAWRRQCERVTQQMPCSGATTRQRTIEQAFPVRSVLESRLPEKQSWTSGWGLGWGTSKSSQPSPIEAPKGEQSAHTGTVLDEIRQYLTDDVEETPKDRGQREMCEKFLDNLLRTSPTIRFMMKHLALVGCSPIDDKGRITNIMIAKCSTSFAGGFSPSAPNDHPGRAGLLLCQNGIIDKQHMEATMTHEMMHWFDHCRFKVNWQDWRHVACSEIRANNLSGDCRFWRDNINRGHVGFIKHHQTCVRRRAVDSLVQMENGPKDRQAAERIVDEVWDSCFNDTRPFDEIY